MTNACLKLSGFYLSRKKPGAESSLGLSIVSGKIKTN